MVMNEPWSPPVKELDNLVLTYLKAKLKLWLEITFLKERAQQGKKRPMMQS